MCIITIIIKTLYAMRIGATIDVNSHSLFSTHSLNVLYNRISTISISPITIPINNIVNIAFTISIPPTIYNNQGNHLQCQEDVWFPHYKEYTFVNKHPNNKLLYIDYQNNRINLYPISQNHHIL